MCSKLMIGKCGLTWKEYFAIEIDPESQACVPQECFEVKARDQADFVHSKINPASLSGPQPSIPQFLPRSVSPSYQLAL